jgi:hypothetical protein
MNEDELRAALRTTMTVTLAPPSMSAADAVSRGRRSQVRQRAAWIGSGGAAAVAVFAVALAATAGRPPGDLVGGPPPSALPTVSGAPVPAPTVPGKTVWPTGPDGSPQEDRTARAGAKYDEGKKLLDDLVGAVPAGFGAPDSPAERYHQAQFEDRVGGRDIWSFMAIAQVTKDGGTGSVAVEVHAAGNTYTAPTGCALTRQFWGLGGQCHDVTVNGVRIGVVDTPGLDNRFDQWAAYRYPDGTVVFVAQGRTSETFSDPPAATPAKPLTALPYTVDDLAALAMRPEFHIG